MQRRAVNVITEYAGHANAEVRRNVATALAAVGERESVEALVEMALADGDAAVRDHAAGELARLAEPAAGEAEGILLRMLREDAGRRGAAYRLLGRMRLHGSRLRARWAPLWRRVMLVRSVKALGEGAGRRSAWGSLFAGVKGGLVAAIFLGLYLAAVLRIPFDSSVFNFLLFASPAVAGCLALTAGRRVNPIALQFDRRAAAVTEALATAWPAVVLAAAFCFVVFLTNAEAVRTGGSAATTAFLLMSLLAGVFVAAIRLGAMMAAGVGGGAWRQRLAAVLTGTACGLLVALGAAALLRRMPVADAVGSLVQTAWLLLLPSAGALANVFAEIDREVPAREPMAAGGLLARLAIALLVALLLLPPLALLLGRPPAPGGARAAAPGKRLKIALAAGEAVRFDADFPQDVRCIGDCEKLAVRQESGAAVERGGRPEPMAFKTDFPAADQSGRHLAPGTYSIFRRKADVAPETVLASLTDLVRSVWRKRPIGDAVQVVLNDSLEGPLPPLAVFTGSEPQEGSGFWSIQTVPAEHRFRLLRRAAVEVAQREETELQEGGGKYLAEHVDFAIRISGGKEGLSGDDPPVVRKVLDPGEYKVQVRTLNENARLPEDLHLDLRIREVPGPPAGVPQPSQRPAPPPAITSR